MKPREGVSMTEHEMCVKLMEWVKLNMKRYPFLELFHHIPNEGKRNPATVPGEGYLPGIPDYCLPFPAIIKDEHYRGFYLEMKRPPTIMPRRKGGRPNENQKQAMALLRGWGFWADWTDNLQQAIDWTAEYCQGVQRLRDTE